MSCETARKSGWRRPRHHGERIALALKRAILVQPNRPVDLISIRWKDAAHYYRSALAAVEVRGLCIRPGLLLQNLTLLCIWALALFHKAGIAHLDFADYNMLHDERTGTICLIDFEGCKATVDGTDHNIGLYAETPGLNFDGPSDGFASDVYACGRSFKYAVQGSFNPVSLLASCSRINGSLLIWVLPSLCSLPTLTTS